MGKVLIKFKGYIKFSAEGKILSKIVTKQLRQRNDICLPQRDLVRNSCLPILAYFKHDSDQKFEPKEFRLFETAKTLVFRICYGLLMLICCHTKAVYHTGCLRGCQYVTQTWNQLQNKSSWCQTINMNNKPPSRPVF